MNGTKLPKKRGQFLQNHPVEKNTELFTSSHQFAVYPAFHALKGQATFHEVYPYASLKYLLRALAPDTVCGPSADEDSEQARLRACAAA